MFTGIIRDTSTIQEVAVSEKGQMVIITKPKGWKVRSGDSVNVNGVCSTVLKHKNALLFEYMPESISRSSISAWRENDKVNLERSLFPTDRLDGHIVQGHIDTVATVAAVIDEGNAKIVQIAFAKKDSPYMRLIVEKGSIAIEGISLTLAKIKGLTANVKILPYTWDETNLHTKSVGDMVNVEFDILAKYVQRMIQK